MRKTYFLFIIVVIFTTIGCKKNNSDIPNGIENIAGTNYRTITTSDGQDREFIVYIPNSAAGDKEVPVLFVVHGTNQTGLEFYNKNLWNPKADEEGFIVVYPTALTYCHFDEGEQRTTTKWAAGDLGETDVNMGALPLCEGEILHDDMIFFDELISAIKEDYVVDKKRFYITGFSNGAQMTARLIAQRPEVFAAAAIHAGNLSNFIASDLATRQMSLIVSVGASDPYLLKAVGTSNPVPVNSDAVNIAGVKNLLEPFLELNGLDYQSTYTNYQYYGNEIADFKFDNSNIGENNYLRFVLIENLEHSYTSILINSYWSFLKEQNL